MGENPSSPPRWARVLIVDDIAENRLLIGVCCERFGLAHEAVESGRDAVTAVQSGRFDVVLMDILMPRMDGISATRVIRGLPGDIGAIPIIAVTTAAEPGEMMRYRECGMNGVVPKPVRPAELAQALSDALAASRRIRRPPLLDAG